MKINQLSRKVLFCLGMLGTTAAFDSVAQASFAPTYLAKATGRIQCPDTPETEIQSLGDAIAEIEAFSTIVSEAYVGRLANQLTCLACSCYDGTYNIVKIENFENIQNIITQAGWQVVYERDLLLDVQLEE